MQRCRLLFIMVLLLVPVANGFAQSATISTYAGPVLPTDGRPATTQGIDMPTSIASDGAGGFYVASPAQNRIYHVAASGVLTRFAGTGSFGSTGDGGPALSAELQYPYALAVDAAGNLFFSEVSRVRRVSTTGIVTTVAGGGTTTGTGDGGPATSVELTEPTGLFVDALGNLLIADAANNRIRKVSTGGIITTIAGGGQGGGDGDLATAIALGQLAGISEDSAGNLYIADLSTHSVREVLASTGMIETFAGNGHAGDSGDGGPATLATLSAPTGLTVDAFGNLFIADTGNSDVRKVSPSGVITTVSATSSGLTAPAAVAFNSAGSLLVADSFTGHVWEASAGSLINVAGSGTVGYGGDGGPATAALLASPIGTAVDGGGNLFIADKKNHRIRKVSTSGTITTVAGNGFGGDGGDNGAAILAQLNLPSGVAVDQAGNLFIADTGNNKIRRVTNGVITTFAGTGDNGFSGDGGPATAAGLTSPSSLAFDVAGDLYIVDSGNNRIREVTPASIISTVAGNGIAGGIGDGGPALAGELNHPTSVSVDQAGDLFIAESVVPSGNPIREVTTSGSIISVPGTVSSCCMGPYTPSNVPVGTANGVALDSAGDLFIAGNNAILKLTAGTITTVAGGVQMPLGITQGFSGDGGPPTSAQITQPGNVTVDANGNLIISDTGNNRIRLVSTTGALSGNGSASFSSSSGGIIPEVEEGSILSGFVLITPDTGSSAPTVTVSDGIVSGGVVQSSASFTPSPLMTSATLSVNSNPAAGQDLGVAITWPAAMATTTSDLTTVSLTLMNASGQIAATTVVTLGVEFPGPFAETPLPQPQVAKFVSQFFGPSVIGTGFQGSLEVQSSTPFALLALQFTGEQFNPVVPSNVVAVSGIPLRTLTGGPSSNPSTPLAGTVGGGAAIFVPQFAMSGGWATQLTLANSSNVAITGRVDVFDGAFGPLPVELNGNVQSTFRYSVVPNGSYLLAPRNSAGQAPLP